MHHPSSYSNPSASSPATVVAGSPVARLRAVFAALVATLVMAVALGANAAQALMSTTWVQTDLRGISYYFDSIDGSYGPNTRAAVTAFQRDNCLSVDGQYGPQTEAALLAKVKAVQSKVGVSADGLYGSGTTSAVRSWQASHGLSADGIAGPNTMSAMGIKRVLSCGGVVPSLTNPYGGSMGSNGGWTPRAAWLRDQIKARFGVTCTTYATSSTSSDHYTGNAMDCWGDVGTRRTLQYWAANNAASLQVYYVIHEQRIWNITKPSSGWVWMADRGSPTQNHMDHVHISMQHPGDEY